MNFFKRLFSIIFEPLKLSGSRNFAESLAKFFTHKGFVVYILSFVLTLAIFLIIYLA